MATWNNVLELRNINTNTRPMKQWVIQSQEKKNQNINESENGDDDFHIVWLPKSTAKKIQIWISKVRLWLFSLKYNLLYI